MILSKELDVAIDLLFSLKVKTLQVYAKSHGIRLGKNKSELIENIAKAIQMYELSVQALPGASVLISFVLVPAPVVEGQKR